MADLAKLIEKAEKQLEDQNVPVKAAKKDVKLEELAWQTAKGKQTAVRKCIWQAAVKREEEERECNKAIETRLQKLIDKLPSAYKQALILKCLLVCHSFTLLEICAHQYSCNGSKRSCIRS